MNEFLSLYLTLKSDFKLVIYLDALCELWTIQSQLYTYIYDLYARLHSVHIVIRSHYAKQANMAAVALQPGLNFALAAEVGPLLTANDSLVRGDRSDNKKGHADDLFNSFQEDYWPFGNHAHSDAASSWRSEVKILELSWTFSSTVTALCNLYDFSMSGRIKQGKNKHRQHRLQPAGHTTPHQQVAAVCIYHSKGESGRVMISFQASGFMHSCLQLVHGLWGWKLGGTSAL